MSKEESVEQIADNIIQGHNELKGHHAAIVVALTTERKKCEAKQTQRDYWNKATLKAEAKIKDLTHKLSEAEKERDHMIKTWMPGNTCGTSPSKFLNTQNKLLEERVEKAEARLVITHKVFGAESDKIKELLTMTEEKVKEREDEIDALLQGHAGDKGILKEIGACLTVAEKENKRLLGYKNNARINDIIKEETEELQTQLDMARDELKHASIFIRTKEKMHPDGIALFDLCLEKLKEKA